MSYSLAESFNALPKPPTITLDDKPVPNEWHFDLRFWRRVPVSTLCLVIIQPHPDATKVELVPLGYDPSLDKSVAFFKYFPETYEDAAPDIVQALLYYFTRRRVQLPAPCRFMTKDKALADAVGAELRRQGVCPRLLCDVQISSAEVNKFVDGRVKAVLEPTWSSQDMFRRYDDDHLPKTVSLFHSAPDPPVPGGYENLVGPARYAVMARHYDAIIARGTPPDGGPNHGPKSLVKEYKRLVEIQQLLMEEPIYVVKSAADLGDAGACLDFGIRLSLGLDCKRNRKFSRHYLMKAAGSKTAAAMTKATANGILVFWYLEASFTEHVPVHFLYAACHHADLAVRFCEEASNTLSSPAAHWLLDMVLSDDFRTPEDMLWMYHDLFELDEVRDTKKRELDRAVHVDMALRPHKYFCAAAGCDIVVDSAKALSRCAGKCDRDKKPRYCSWHCQRADWAAHKQFCRPGAKCSAIEDASVLYAKYGDPKAPTLSKTLAHLVADDAPILRSSTLSAAQLSALAPLTGNYRRIKFPKKEPSFIQSTALDVLAERKVPAPPNTTSRSNFKRRDTLVDRLSSCQASPQSNSSESTLEHSDLDSVSSSSGSDGKFAAMVSLVVIEPGIVQAADLSPDLHQLEALKQSNIPWHLFRSM